MSTTQNQPGAVEGTAPGSPSRPLTCEVCSNTPASQAMVCDYRDVGRHVLLVCAPCGDDAEPDARRMATVNRFALAPIGGDA